MCIIKRERENRKIKKSGRKRERGREEIRVYRINKIEINKRYKR